MVGSVNNQPVSVADLVEGGRTPPGEVEGSKGVVVGSRPRLGKIACSGPGNCKPPTSLRASSTSAEMRSPAHSAASTTTFEN